MLAVGGATTSFASSPAADMRVSVDASDRRRSYDWCRTRFEGSFTPRGGRHCWALPRPLGAPFPASAPLGEAAAPRLRNRLDPGVGAKSAQTARSSSLLALSSGVVGGAG